MNRNAVTIADVAERAGVSKTTVSHALSGKRPVASPTRARILEVIRELDFQPNQLARSLRMQQTHLVALIIPDLTNPFYPALARGLQEALKEYNYSVILCNTDAQLHQEIAFISEAIHRRVDGVVLASPYDRTEALQDFIEKPIPFVTLGSSIQHPKVDQVMIDDQQSIRQAITYLIERGHRRIALFGGQSDHNYSQNRLAAYRQALENWQLPFEDHFVIGEEHTLMGGEQAMHVFLERFAQIPERPTAIFCINDLVAIGAIRVAKQAGLSIPQDLAFIGTDDLDVSAFIDPPLTTIQNPAFELGKSSGKLLLERMQGNYHGAGRQAIIPYRFIRRASA